MLPSRLLDGKINFLPMHGNMLGSFNPEADSISANVDHFHHDVIRDNDALVLLAG
jgi:hypothetical protein